MKGLHRTGESFSRDIYYEVNLASPEYEIDRPKKILYYSRGRIMDSIKEFQEDALLGFALQMQIQLELETDLFNRLPGGNNIWRPYKEEGENYIVKPTIREFLSSPPNRKTEINKAKEDAYERFFDKTASAYEQVARTNGLKAVNDEGYGAGIDMIMVEVFTEPDGGTVKVIPLLAYKMYQALGRSSDLWPWKSLVRSKELLLENYRYLVTWPDGSTKEGQFELKYQNPLDKKPEKITFKR
jgi:hypothetical protein